MIPRTPLGPDGKPLPYMAHSPLAHGITMAMWEAIAKEVKCPKCGNIKGNSPHWDQECPHGVVIPIGLIAAQYATKVSVPLKSSEEIRAEKRAEKPTELVQGEDGVWRVPGCNTTSD